MTSVRDIIIVSVVLFAIGITVIFAVMLGHRVNTKLLEVPTINNTPGASEIISHTDLAINSTDYIYLALFIGFFISIIITGWIFSGSQIMTPIYFFIVVLFTFVSIIVQNIWVDIATNPLNVTTIAALPLTNFILTHLGYFTAVMGLVGILVMYAKPQITGGY